MSTAAAAKAQFWLERTYKADLQDVWDLWTTKQGIESWWGPEGFEVKVERLDLRPGGHLVYIMTAVAAAQVGFMKQAGMPLTTECRVTYTEVAGPTRLSFNTLADFVPGVEPYEVETRVEFEEVGDEIRIVISHDAMHDDFWTGRARAGEESQLRKLDRLIRDRSTSAP
ncbi:SRPBCC domain-containing protein [Sphingomonas koreensis]|nr:SRPBCC domain-containing protein [Sphingomonas koreensis]